MKEIFHRVSIRRFADRPVEEEKITEILRAAMQAPSAKNQQPWEFYVIRDKEIIRRLAASGPFSRPVETAPVVIVPVYREDCAVPVFAEVDMSIATENLWLMTDALGLGGVWIGTAPVEERMRAVEEILGIIKATKTERNESI